MSDPAKYRTREEVQKMREEHDPIEQVRARLIRNKQATEDDLKQVDAKVVEYLSDLDSGVNGNDYQDTAAGDF